MEVNPDDGLYGYEPGRARHSSVPAPASGKRPRRWHCWVVRSLTVIRQVCGVLISPEMEEKKEPFSLSGHLFPPHPNHTLYAHHHRPGKLSSVNTVTTPQCRATLALNTLSRASFFPMAWDRMTILVSRQLRVQRGGQQGEGGYMESEVGQQAHQVLSCCYIKLY